MTIRWNPSQFRRHFDALSRIGPEPDGAMHRPFGSDANLEARNWLRTLSEVAGLGTSFDAAGNIWGILPAFRGLEDTSQGGSNVRGHVQRGFPRRTIVIGSHHDSVPHGGCFDGALGVLAGVKIVQAIKDFGYENRHSIAFVSFTAEEPNPFELSTLGSRCLAGRLGLAQLRKAHAVFHHPRCREHHTWPL